MKKDQPSVTPCDDLSYEEASGLDTVREVPLEVLLSEAKAGSLEAYHNLHLRYRPLIDASIARYSGGDMSLQEREDMREEAERIFLTAISTYDTDQDSVDFGLYAKICLRNGLVSEVRSLTARRRLGIVPLDSENVIHAENPEEDLMAAESFRRLYAMIHGNLSDFENRVWWRYVSGVSVKEIAKHVGKDERSVHNAIYRIRKKLRVLLADEK
ncbi:MAG: sigma-70 family RNA polymerase sigma factor [Ruminococcaceae bacterium]|nr:sigma-70 family RNA polymerase sigma factor [Oscillospiraceae bacterium]